MNTTLGWSVAVRNTSPAKTPRVGAAIHSLVLAIWRSAAVVVFSLYALFEIAIVITFVRPEHRLFARAAWLHRWCRFACRVLGIRPSVRGIIPSSGLLICNHLSYLDIVVLCSLTPCVFVAKRDVASWPIFGWLARAAGTIFVDRRRKMATTEAVSSLRNASQSGVLIVLFPEGTSSDGRSVLPFKSALLQPAFDLDCAITTASINYRLERGSVADEVCYWRDMTLVPHLLNLFTKPTIESDLVVRSFNGCAPDRKELARTLRSEILAMRS